MFRSISFKNENITIVLDLLRPEDQIVTLNVRDGYHHLAVREQDRNYLVFCLEGQLYRWRVLPFGLSVASFYFCQLMRVVITFLREQNLRCSCYVDDFILCAHRSKITDHSDLLTNTLQDLGISINWEKSHMQPSV